MDVSLQSATLAHSPPPPLVTAVLCHSSIRLLLPPSVAVNGKPWNSHGYKSDGCKLIESVVVGRPVTRGREAASDAPSKSSPGKPTHPLSHKSFQEKFFLENS